MARFIRSPNDRTVAEVAVAVADDRQGQGLGTALLDELTARARDEGIKRFSAVVLAENEPMLEVLRAAGETQVTGRSHEILNLLMDLPPVGIPEPLSHTIRAAARGYIRQDPKHPVADR